MARSKSSKRWLEEHFSDPFVKKAQAAGLRSRAAFKLQELLDQRDLKIKPGMVIVDLGAAPGGWSQLLSQRLKGRGRIVALDLLEMAALPDVEFFQGDFTDEAVLKELESRLGGQPVDLVVSDMAPNMSGVTQVDIPRSYVLAEMALDFARQWLKPQGEFLIKLFQGEGFDAYLKALRSSFASLKMRKPEASRGRSREVYALATGFRVE